MHIRHLLVAFDDTPDHKGLAIGLVQDAELVNKLTKEMLGGLESNTFETVFIDAESEEIFFSLDNFSRPVP